jgi:hypothetical protein
MAGTVPFEQTVAAVKPDLISSSDIARYVNVNLPRLERFIQRELQYRQDQGQLSANQVTVKEVVDEAIANALGEQNDKPERMKLEPWVHRLAREAIDTLALDARDNGMVSLERSHGGQNVQGSDEALLQFHQPDEQLVEENVIPDPTANTPEELAARSELLNLVESDAARCGTRRAGVVHPVYRRGLHAGRNCRHHQPYCGGGARSHSTGQRSPATLLADQRPSQRQTPGAFQERLILGAALRSPRIVIGHQHK